MVCELHHTTISVREKKLMATFDEYIPRAHRSLATKCGDTGSNRLEEKWTDFVTNESVECVQAYLH